MLAYLVIREGSKWTDVFRLVPGEPVTIGRAPTNRIVVRDDRCSRFHADVFASGDAWYVRDLDSRNGTAVGDDVVHGQRPLRVGDVIRIGNTQMAFVHDLSQAFPDSSGITASGTLLDASDRPASDSIDESAAFEPTMITHRRMQTRFLAPGEQDDSIAPHQGRAAATLCRLAFELAKAPDATSLARAALEGLFEGTRIDAGAILLLAHHAAMPDAPPSAPADVAALAAELEIVAKRSDTELPYQRVTPFLAGTVLSKGEAVLARNVMGDSQLQARDSKGLIPATSVLAAPIRRGRKVFGLVHVYATLPDRVPDPDDLEFTLAVAETLAVALANLARRQELADNLKEIRDENRKLREQLGVQSEIVGRSRAMARITEEIARAAPTNATVLIRGESGVGKELVARAVHFSSPRAKGPFVCLNCAALSETLLESELFGHERGAFTGAHTRKIGKFEAADHGTLLLDEIGEMSPALQAKFLRVLEGHPFERLGGSEAIRSDVRVIAATNRDLEKEVAEGRFRRDLYFRLRVVEIVVPALRKRPEDIPELSQYFFSRFAMETGRRLRGFTPEAIERMHQYRWPGNVRELKNVIERAVVLARGEWIDVGDLMLSQLPTSGDTMDAGPLRPEESLVSLEEMERQHILRVLRATRGNKSQAASILGIERSTLDRKIKRYELADYSPSRGV